MGVKIRNPIGSCKVDEDVNIIELEREFFRQGYLFKDWAAFYSRPTEPCYVLELDNTIYIGYDFMKLCNEQEEIAKELFYSVDWQSPSKLLDE